MLIVDPHGEYDTLTQMRGCATFLTDNDYRPQRRGHPARDVKVRISSLTLGDLRYLLPDMSERMHYVLGRAYGLVRASSAKSGRWPSSVSRCARPRSR